MSTAALTVVGVPAPQGSKRAFVNRNTGRAVVVEQQSKRVGDWRSDVKAAALDRFDEPPMEGPIWLTVVYRLPRPRSHYRTGRNAHMLRDNAPAFPARMPDLDKLDRATLDALTGVAFVDDGQVVGCDSSKRYALRSERSGAAITVDGLDDYQAKRATGA